MRIYLANLTEFDLINSFHLHADFFRYQPTGTGDHWEYTDIVMQCQGQRGVIEIDFAHTGTFMFHAHQSEFTELGWMGFFDVVELMERARGDDAVARRLAALGARADPAAGVVVGLFVSSGSSLVDLIGKNPPPADEFDVRRVEFQPGEIRIGVTNPQRDDLTIASVTVDDAIVPFTLDGPRRARPAALEHDRRAVSTGSRTSRSRSASPARPASRRPKEIAAAVETPTAVGARASSATRSSASSSASCRSRSACSGCRRCAAPTRSWLAAFMALTAGLLTFLGVEALFEAFELQAALPAALGGPGLVLLGVAVSFLAMTFLVVAARPRQRRATGLALATLVAHRHRPAQPRRGPRDRHRRSPSAS